ncbi:MAG TPA: hypothetical protein VG326_10990 [Tepidisphaeraceae bacterium]|jgi:hypothetical protein|nr:hypothetical protein [Tepidisphaeraceae bacterium]
MIGAVTCFFRLAWTRSIAAILLCLLILSGGAGCALFVKALEAGGPPTEPPKYAGLAGHSVAVVIWAEENGVRIDWPRLNLDAAQMVQFKLQKIQKENKPKELVLTRFPLSAASVARFQEENPEWASQGMEEIAPKLGVSRVIYIEIRSFQTRADAAIELFRGTVTGSVSVIEVSGGKGRVAFSDDNIKISYPKTSPEEGLPNIGDFAIYHGLLDGFTTEIAKLFVTHGNDADAEYSIPETDAAQ